MSALFHAGPSLQDPRYRCMCGALHVVTASKVCLILYVGASIFSIVFGSKDLLTWLLVPAFVVTLSVYAFATERHKYLYPFLIITVVQQFVCLIMAFIVVCFAMANFDAVRKILAHSLLLEDIPGRGLTLFLITATVACCLIVALLHVWQALIIYRCLEYYEELSVSNGNSPSSRGNDGDTVADWTGDYRVTGTV